MPGTPRPSGCKTHVRSVPPRPGPILTRLLALSNTVRGGTPTARRGGGPSIGSLASTSQQGRSCCSWRAASTRAAAPSRRCGRAAGHLGRAAALLADTALRIHDGDARLHRVLFEESPRPPALLEEIRRLQDALVGPSPSCCADPPAAARARTRRAADGVVPGRGDRVAHPPLPRRPAHPRRVRVPPRADRPAHRLPAPAPARRCGRAVTACGVTRRISPAGVEPASPASEAGALSAEPRGAGPRPQGDAEAGPGDPDGIRTHGFRREGPVLCR